MTKEFNDEEYGKNKYALVKLVGQNFTIEASEFIRLQRTGKATISVNGDTEQLEIIEDNSDCVEKEW